MASTMAERLIAESKQRLFSENEQKDDGKNKRKKDENFHSAFAIQG